MPERSGPLYPDPTAPFCFHSPQYLVALPFYTISSISILLFAYRTAQSCLVRADTDRCEVEHDCEVIVFEDTLDPGCSHVGGRSLSSTASSGPLSPRGNFSSVEEYVEYVGGQRAIKKVLIANNGIAAVKAIRSIRRWAFETFQVGRAEGERGGGWGWKGEGECSRGLGGRERIPGYPFAGRELGMEPLYACGTCEQCRDARASVVADFALTRSVHWETLPSSFPPSLPPSRPPWYQDERAVSFVVMATPDDMRANAEYIRMADEVVDVPGGEDRKGGRQGGRERKEGRKEGGDGLLTWPMRRSVDRRRFFLERRKEEDGAGETCVNLSGQSLPLILPSSLPPSLPAPTRLQQQQLRERDAHRGNRRTMAGGRQCGRAGATQREPPTPGFLGETDRKIVFIGPPGAPMRALGDKIGSTIIAQSAGVPVIAWNGNGIV